MPPCNWVLDYNSVVINPELVLVQSVVAFCSGRCKAHTFSLLPTRFCYAWHCQSRGDFIVVGDLMRSVSLLVYKAVDGAIEVGAAAHCCQGGGRCRILPCREKRVSQARVYVRINVC